MTQTALKNKEIESKENIAKADRELAKQKFAHEKKMDVIKSVVSGVTSLFTPAGKLGKAAKVAGAVITANAAARKGRPKNDAKIYKRYIPDLDKFTNISTYNRAGHTTFGGNYSHFAQINDGQYNIGAKFTAPGIAVLRWIPSIGNVSKSNLDISTSPINQILMRTKEQVLKSNSRSSVPYEASDLGLNFLASGSIIVAIAEFERALLVAQTYKGNNAYYAKTMLTALGWDADNFLANLPNVRQYLLLLKKRFNSAIVCPKDLSYYDKLIYLGTMWVKDSEAEPNQIYSAIATKYWKLDDEGDSLTAIMPDRATVVRFYNQVSSMIQAISENPDFVAMYADLRSAFNSLITLDESVDQTAEITATYESDSIEQIANIETLPVYAGDELYEVDLVDGSINVNQDSSGYLYQGLSTTDQGIKFKIDHEKTSIPLDISGVVDRNNKLPSKLMNLHKDEVTGDDILDSTRWKYKYSDVTKNADDDYFFRVISSDTAVAWCWYIYTIQVYSNGTISNNVFTAGSDLIVTEADADLNDVVTNFSVVTTFDWMPLTRMTIIDNNKYYVSVHGDLQHGFEYPVANMEQLNLACVLSEMYINTESFKR